MSWSSACVGATCIEEFAAGIGRPLTSEIKAHIAEDVVQIAYRIYHGKKATYYGIAGALSTICKAVAKNERRVLNSQILCIKILKGCKMYACLCRRSSAPEASETRCSLLCPLMN